MKIKLYPFQHYTHSGNLKPPIFFNFILFFLARTWGLLIIFLVLRDSGNQLLEIFYPQKAHFYLGLSSGFIAIILFFLAGRDHDKHRMISKLWQFGYPFLLLSILIDLGLQLFYLAQIQFQYSFTASVQLVLGIWILLYCLRSKHLKDCFKRNN
ncbi:MAG: DUF2919 domain-containing protein [Psychromonas sp.]